ncbi:MAG: ChaB family protein [Oculatellaceae cyanobacterium bins.114]|nr:ChaB family protein [Oculatellaceae cyanobacterium bins.114]
MQNVIYRRVEDLPQDVKDHLSAQSQQLFLTNYNQLLEKGCDWGSAFQLAWANLGLSNNQ